MPVMSAILGRGPTRPCVAWTSSETNTVRPNPLGARARNGRQGTASPATNPPPKDSASPGGRPPGTPPGRGGPTPPDPPCPWQAQEARHQRRAERPYLDRGSETEANSGPGRPAPARVADVAGCRSG